MNIHEAGLVCMQVAWIGDDDTTDGSLIGECATCGEEVWFQPLMRDEIVRKHGECELVCLTCVDFSHLDGGTVMHMINESAEIMDDVGLPAASEIKDMLEQVKDHFADRGRKTWL